MATVQGWLRSNLLLLLTLAGVGLGVTVGLSLRPLNLAQQVTCGNVWSVSVTHMQTVLMLAYPGELFMRLLRLLTLPLVVASLVTGTAGLNARLSGRLALRTLTYFLAGSCAANIRLFSIQSDKNSDCMPRSPLCRSPRCFPPWWGSPSPWSLSPGSGLVKRGGAGWRAGWRAGRRPG